jgi:hypothetical protein
MTWYFELLYQQSLYCLPFTGGIGLVSGIILGLIRKNPTFWWKGMGIGALIGFAICIVFAFAPCGFFGC